MYHIMTTVVWSLRHTRMKHSGAIFATRVPFHRRSDAVSLGTLAAISLKVVLSDIHSVQNQPHRCKKGGKKSHSASTGGLTRQKSALQSRGLTDRASGGLQAELGWSHTDTRGPRTSKYGVAAAARAGLVSAGTAVTVRPHRPWVTETRTQPGVM